MDDFVEKVFVRSVKILYIVINLIERLLQAVLYLLDKTKAFLQKSFEGDKKMKTGVDDIIEKAKNLIEADIFESKPSKITIDQFINKKFDEIIFFRNLTREFPFPEQRENELKDIENNIFNQLLIHSELQKGNSKAEVALIGGFSSGKSTIINSFLKKNICPSKPGAATSSVTKFYYSSESRVTLDNKEITQDQYIKKVQHIGSGKKTETYFFEYGYNNEIFNSIVLYDTPGFDNERNTNDEKVTENILKDADVVIYTIDINKGTVDKKDIERLNRLKKEKNKKFYCIMNKAEGKTSKGIEKIKQEVERFGIFDMIIPYSAKNVLDASSRYSIEKFLDDTKKKIYSKDSFESTIKGEIFKGRRNKDQYRLRLGTQEIEDKDIDSIIQQWNLKNILTNISTQKQQILQNSFNENEKRYKAKVENLLKNILSEIDTYPEKKKNSEFEDEIGEIFSETERMEKARDRTIKICIANAYKKALYIKKRIVKGMIWDDTYYRVSINQATYTNELACLKENCLEIMKYMKERLKNIENKHKIVFKYPTIDNRYLYKKSKEILTYSGDNKLDIFQGGLYGTDEYTDKDEVEKNKQYYRQKADSIVGKNYKTSILLKSFIDINRKTIDQKTGMLKQDDVGKQETKEQVKEKIKNYIEGEINAK